MEPYILKKLEHDAIDFALSSNWAGALESNIEILSSFPQNVPALLRAGFASFQLKSLTESQKYYQKVIDLQPQNPIASEYIEKIQVMLDNHSPTSKSVSSIDPSIFVEYPGKTKLATLSQLGQKNVLAKLVVGDQVLLAVRKRHVEARTSTDEYIGILPDDIGTRLIYFIEHESAYTAHIHSSNMSSVAIFIREIQKGKKVDRMAWGGLEECVAISQKTKRP
jgi:tetratricopeptide (TPR) repeat protein